MQINSSTEWEKLRKVIVGSVDNFCPPVQFNSPVDEKIISEAINLASKAYPKSYLDEVAEDLEELCKVLTRFGADVIRPKWPSDNANFSTPNWSASGFDIYNVRDLHIVFGNTVVVSAPSSRFRLFEHYAMQELFYEHFFDNGFKWIASPTPQLKGDYLYEIDRKKSDLEKNEDVKHEALSGGLSEVYHRLEENEVIFDAANIIRFGDHALYLVSSTGNKKAVKWLQNTIPDVHFYVTEAYRSSHLDSTILPLSDGKVLLNSARVNEANCPEFLNNWDKLFFNDPAPVCEKELDFHKNHRIKIYNELKSKNIDSNIGYISSPWAGLNLLSLDSKTVLVHDRQTNLIKTLEKWGFEVIPIRMRHCYTMLGGLHCTTLDVVRYN
jgi:N-dimethylarginine dimethylaminohydrolase